MWQKLTGGSDSNGIKTGDTVTTAGYTYTANLDLEYEPSGDFSDGLLRARGSNGNTVFLNNAGQLALTLGDEYTIANYDGNFHEGLLAVGCDDLYYSNPYSLEANDDFGYLDKTGELAIPCQFASAGDFSNGYAVVSTVVSDDEPTAFDSVSGYYDDDGNYIEETIVDYYDNVIQKYGVIDTSGNFVVEYQDYDIDESSTFENGVYKASDPDTYIQYCFTIQGENLGEANYYNSNSCYAEDTSSDAVAARESIQESLGDQYTVKDFNDGVALVISKESMGSAYFVDLQGNKVFDLMSVNLVEVRSYEYSEGLFMAYVWDGSDPYPGFEAMISGDDDTEEFANSVFNNTSIVYFDAKGQIVFRYHFADHYDSMEQYQAMNTYNSD